MDDEGNSDSANVKKAGEDIKLLSSGNSSTSGFSRADSSFNSNLENILNCPNDCLTTVLEPSQGEIAATNPIPLETSEGNFLLYRAEVPVNVPEGTDFSKLTPRNRRSEVRVVSFDNTFPIRSQRRVLIKPEPGTEFYKYERLGCEDQRAAEINGQVELTYTGSDGVNALIMWASSDTDLNKVTKQGVISPHMALERAIALTKSSFYKDKWKKSLKSRTEDLPKLRKFFGIPGDIQVKLEDKDGFLDFNPKTGLYEFYHRIHPYGQVAFAKSLQDFQNLEYWIEYIRDLDKHTILRPYDDYKDGWIGWGGKTFYLKDPITGEIKKVGLYHVAIEPDKKTVYYYSSLFEIKNGRIIAMIKNPVLKPTEEDKFEFVDDTGKPKTKYVAFGMGGFYHEPTDKLFLLYGSADRYVRARTVLGSWVCKELNHPDNRILEAA